MFKLDEFMGKRVLKSSLIDDKNVVAFFTTRDLPLKSGERDDLIEEVEQNKKLISIGLNIPQENLVIPIQTHSDNVAIIKIAPHLNPPPLGGRKNSEGQFNNSVNFSPLTSHLSPFEDTDALITNQKEIAIGLNFADCVPIIFYDPIKKVVACAHAGWRGTVAKIGPKTVEKMVKEFGSKPEDIIALIGSAIGKCCFEIGEDVKSKLLETIDVVGLNKKAPHPKPSPSRREGAEQNQTDLLDQCFENSHADLKQINKIQLLANGLKKIDVCEYCTSCQSELFFSYRKEKGKTARHSAVITLTNN